MTRTNRTVIIVLVCAGVLLVSYLLYEKARTVIDKKTSDYSNIIEGFSLASALGLT